MKNTFRTISLILLLSTPVSAATLKGIDKVESDRKDIPCCPEESTYDYSIDDCRELVEGEERISGECASLLPLALLGGLSVIPVISGNGRERRPEESVLIPPPIEVAAIPEPSGAMGILLGMGYLVSRRIKRISNKNK